MRQVFQVPESHLVSYSLTNKTHGFYDSFKYPATVIYPEVRHMYIYIYI